MLPTVNVMIANSGKNQKEIADAIGTTQVSMSRYVKGTRQPKYETYFAIAKACGYRIEVTNENNKCR